MPVFAISFYQYLEKEAHLERTALIEAFNSAKTEEEKSIVTEEMLAHSERLQESNPDDADGWLMLTNSYVAIERYPDALRAVENLYRLKSDEPSVIVRYADILSMINNGRFKGKPTELIDEALRLDPKNKNGLWLAGLAAIQRADIKKALQHWQQLHDQFNDGSESQLKIKHYIELARQQLIEPDKETLSDIALKINIVLSENLLTEVNDNDDVYIYAQAIDGSLMPLAISRVKASELPTQVTLDDSMALVPSNKLSDHKQIQLIARVSKNAATQSSPGDLIGVLNSVPTNIYLPVKLIIDDIIQ